MKDAVEKALAINDELGEAYVTRAVIERIENGDTPVVETYFRKAIDLSPNYATAHQWYGAFLGSTNRQEQGLASKQRALSLDPESATLAYDVGFTLMQMARDDQALEQFRAAIELDPAIPGPYERIADIQSVRGRIDEAIRSRRKAVTLDPGDPIGRVFLGENYLDIGDTDEAQKWFDRAADLAPPEFRLAEGLKEPLLLRRGDLEGAVEFARINIVHAPGRHTLATLRDHDLRNADFDAALARYQDFFPNLISETPPSVNEDDLEFAVDVALVLLRMGRADLGEQLLNKSLEIISEAASQTDSYVFGIQRVMIHALQGDTESALDSLRQTIDDGWRATWWIYLEIDPSLDSIRNEPEYQAMLQEVRDDMAAQRRRLEEWEAAGKLEPIPDADLE
jgi:tetratricopeptide (TPR) repeat protein